MTTPFGPKFGATGTFSIPGIGADPNTGAQIDRWVLPEMWEIIPSIDKPAPQPAPGPVLPGQEPLAPIEAQPTGLDLAPQTAAPDLMAPETPGANFPTLEEILSGTDKPYDPFVGTPFARQKRALQAIGAPDSAFQSLDALMDNMRNMPEQQRLKTFNAQVPYFESIGLTPAELDETRRYLKILGVPEDRNLALDIISAPFKELGRVAEAAGKGFREQAEAEVAGGEVVSHMVTHPKTTKAAFVTFGRGLAKLPKQTRANAFTATHGWNAATVVDPGRGGRWVAEANADIEKFAAETAKRYDNGEFLPGMPLEMIPGIIQSLSFSVTAGVPGAGAGVTVAAMPIPGARPAGIAAGAAFSGLLAFNMASYQFMQQFLEVKNDESIQERGRPINQAEEDQLKKEMDWEARKFGLWEALPEAAGNAVAFSRLTKPLMATGLGRSTMGKVVNRVGQIYFAEFATETVTQQGQTGLLYKHGLPGGRPVDWTSPTDWLKALGEIAPQTAAVVTITAGTGATVVGTHHQIQMLRQEIGEDHSLFKGMVEKIQQNASDKARQIRSAVTTPAYEKYLYPEMHRLSPREKTNIETRNLGTEGVLGVDYYRDMIRTRNWQGVFEEASMGRFPTADELGVTWLNNELSEAKEGVNETEELTIDSIMSFAVSHPAANWYRSNTETNYITQRQAKDLRTRYGRDFQDISIGTQPTLLAPDEVSPQAAADPQHRQNIAVFGIANRTVTNYASNKFMDFIESERYIPLSLGTAYANFTESNTVGRPMTRPEFRGFVDSITEEDIIGQLPVGFDAEAALNYAQEQLLATEEIDQTALQLAMENDGLHVMLPKNDQAVSYLFNRARPAPTPTSVADTATPPPAGTPAEVQADQAVAASVPDSTIAAAGVGANDLAVKTGYTPDEVVFMKTMGMTDEEIQAKAIEEHFIDPELLAPTKTGDRVVVPSFAHQEGTLVDDTNPAAMEVRLDNGATVKVSEDKVFHAKALNFGEEIAPEPDSDITEGEQLWNQLQEGQQVSDEKKAEHPDIVAELEGVEEARRIKAGDKARRVAIHKRRQAAAEQVRPSDDTNEAFLDDLGSELEEGFDAMLEQMAPQPQEIGQAILDPATEGMLQEAAEIVDKVGYTSYGMLKDIFAIPVNRAKNLFAELRNREVIDRQGNALKPGAKPQPGTQRTLPEGETAPSEWTLDDGTPLWQVPLNEYLLQGRPEELQRIRAMRANQFGFNAVSSKEADLYVRRVGSVVENYLPEARDEFKALEAAHIASPGSVPQMKFDNILSRRHDTYARVRYAQEMQVTGETEPQQAASVTHRNAVRQALAEGKEVSDEVLDQYPDMKRIQTETAPLTTTPVKVLNDELKSRGYTAAQVGGMNAQSKEWIISNDMDPTTVTVLENGQVTQLHPQDRPANNPKKFIGISKPQVQADMFNEEMGIVDRIVKMIQENDPEAGFFRPGAALLRMKVFASRVATRMRNSRLAYEADLVQSLEGAIDKWAAEHKLAELYGEWAVINNKKVIERGILEARRTKQPRFKTPQEELEMVARYMDDPDYHQADYQHLSDPAKELIRVLQDSFQELWSVAHSMGLIDQWRANYIYRLYKNDPKRINNVQFGVTNRRLAADPVFGKQRKYEHIRDAEAAGLTPVLDPIMLHRAYVVELARTVANANLINTLMALTTENGLPAVMARPNPGDAYFGPYTRDYIPLPVKGLERWVYARKMGNKGGFVRVEARATPVVAKRLGEVFRVYEPPGRFMRGFMSIKAFIMRLKMLNPVIHGANIHSDKLDEFNLNVKAMLRGQKKAKMDWKNQDEIVVTAVRQGLNIQLAHSTSNEMRRAMIRQSEVLNELSKPFKVATLPLRVLMNASDKALWGYVRNAQLSMWEMMRDKLMRHNPEWSSEKAGRTAAVYVNTNLGTMPAHWMKPWARRFGSIFLFARNWTFSNITMFTEAASKGKYGLGLKGLDTDARQEIGRHFSWHLIKGMVMLFVGLQFAQMGWQALHNWLIDLGLIRGAKVKVRPTFMNESKRHWFDVWVGRNKRGQNLYMVPHYFRYIRDYEGFATDPLQTSMNKMDIFVRAGTEIMANYQAWTESPIIPRGAETGDKIKLGLTYFAETMLPMNYYAKRPGKSPTRTEWIVPFTGTWIRRGTPGGKMGKLYYDYLAWTKFQQDKLDNKIDEAIQDQDWTKFAELSATRYKTSEAKANRIIKFIAPSWYLTRVAGSQELVEFDLWLKKRGQSPLKREYSVADLADGIMYELSDLAAKQGVNFIQETPVDSAREEILRRNSVPGDVLDPRLDRPVPELSIQEIFAPLEQQQATP